MNEYENSVVVIQTYITQRIKETFTHTLRYLLTTPHPPTHPTHTPKTPNNIWGFRSWGFRQATRFAG